MTVMNGGNELELRHLEHFVAVAEEHSFTRAAARLHLVQSALSVSIRSLEHELGSRLFDRSTRHVELTDAGEALLLEARNTLAAAEAARDAVAAVRGGLRGTVRLGIMHSLRLIDVAAVLTRYHREYPRVRVAPAAAHGGSMELVHKVIDGALDVAFVAVPVGDYPSSVTVRPLASEPLQLACPDGHRLACREVVELAELDGERFVDFPAGWGTRLSVDRLFLAAGLRRVIDVEVPDIPIVAELVKADYGCAFLSASLAAGTRALTLRPVDPAPMFEVSLITAADRRVSAATQAFIDLVLATPHHFDATSGP